MIDYKQKISELLHKQLPVISMEDIYTLVEKPPKADMGDFSLPCFKLARQLRKNPSQIATELSTSLTTKPYFARIIAIGPYVNFYLNRALFAQDLLKTIYDNPLEFGKQVPKNKTIVIDFSSPNIAKPFHIGHLRTTVIGNALYHIYQHLGYKCVGINHLGDWGTQFGKQVLAYKLWGDDEIIEKDPINELVKLYVLFHEKAKEFPTLEDQARECFKQLEEGDEDALRIWRWISNVSLKEFKALYKRLNINFDYHTGESFYRDKVSGVINELKEKNLLIESEGAQVVDLGEDIPPCLITKKDGTTIYTSRDIAAAFYRKNTFDFYEALYVVDYSQSLHFKQWIKVIDLMGYEWASHIHHVPFGRVRFAEGKMQTRKGNVILLKDVLNEAVEKTQKIIEARNPNLPNKDDVAEQVAIGAIIFNDLYNNRISDVIFDWDKLLNFDGETGPYVQYTYARSCRVLEKATEALTKEIDYAQFEDDRYFELLKALYAFPDAIIKAGENREPSLISRQIMTIAQTFNRFYHDFQIIVDDPKTQQTRLMICYVVNQVLETGLKLLGIKTPKRM